MHLYADWLDGHEAEELGEERDECGQNRCDERIDRLLTAISS